MKGLSQIRVCPPLASVSFMSHFKEQSFIHPLFMIIKHKHMQHIFHITQKSFRHHTHTRTHTPGALLPSHGSQWSCTVLLLWSIMIFVPQKHNLPFAIFQTLSEFCDKKNILQPTKFTFTYNCMYAFSRCFIPKQTTIQKQLVLYINVYCI